jgi:hypothetical protein
MVQWLAKLVEEVDRQHEELPAKQKTDEGNHSAYSLNEGRSLSTAKEPRYE